MPEDYYELVKAHLTELTTRYPECHYYWIDNPGTSSNEQLAAMYELLRRADPRNVVQFNAHLAHPWTKQAGGETAGEGVAPGPATNVFEKSHGFGFPTDVIGSENRKPNGPVPKLQTWQGRQYFVGYEHCAMLGGSWFKSEKSPGSIKDKFNLYQQIRNDGGNLLLDIGPDRQGRIDDQYAKFLIELKARIEPFEAALAKHHDKAPFDPSKGLKDYAGETIVGSKSDASGREDSVIAGESSVKRYITTLMTANDNKRKMAGWNVFNEMFVYNADGGEYKSDGAERGNCVWMRMGFEADRFGLQGAAKINENHPVVFRKALQYAAMASGKLEIRESRVEEINRKSDALYQLIKHLLNSGVRVDAVGFQSHLNVNQSYDWDSIKRNIRRFKDLGLEVDLTELDVSMGMGWKIGDPFPEAYEKLQAERFYGLVKAAREAGVNRIDFWGLSDAGNQHWLVGQRARLFDGQFQPRPTYQAVLKALYDTQK